MIKRTLVAIAAMALFAASPAVSQTVDTSGLTEQQRIELQAKAAEMRATAADPATAVEKASEWVELGEAIGSGLAAAAEKTGQVVNDFAKTPVGKLTMVLIVYKVMGGDVIQFIVGMLFLSISVPFWARSIWNTTRSTVTITYHENGKRQDVKKEPYRLHASEATLGTWALHWLILLAIIMVAALIIFP